MNAWLQGEVAPRVQSFYERLTEEFRGFLNEQKESLIWFIAACGVILIVVGIRRALAPRTQRAKEISELTRQLVQANALSEEERKLVDDAVKATGIENPAHLFARPTMFDAAARAVARARPAEKQRLDAAYEKLKSKLFS